MTVWCSEHEPMQRMKASWPGLLGSAGAHETTACVVPIRHALLQTPKFTMSQACLHSAPTACVCAHRLQRPPLMLHTVWTCAGHARRAAAPGLLPG